MIELARLLTGKGVQHHPGCWYQDEESIVVPEMDEEGLLHEILHHVVATDAERTWPNLALDDDTAGILAQDPDLAKELDDDWTEATPYVREYQVCHLERVIYGRRGRGVPERSSCRGYPEVTDPHLSATTAWCTERIATLATALGLTSEEVIARCAEALVTFETKYRS